MPCALQPGQSARADASRLRKVALAHLPQLDWQGCEHAAAVPWDDTAAATKHIQAEVQAGRMLVLAVSVDGERRGTTFGRVLTVNGAKEYELYASFGQFDGPEVWEQIVPQIEAFARHLGCQFVRLTTSRPGVVHRFAASGYAAHEVVMRKSLQ